MNGIEIDETTAAIRLATNEAWNKLSKTQQNGSFGRAALAAWNDGDFDRAGALVLVIQQAIGRSHDDEGHVFVLDAATGQYVDSGRVAETHVFVPAVNEDLCLHRMDEGYICQAPRDASVHQG